MKWGRKCPITVMSQIPPPPLVVTLNGLVVGSLHLLVVCLPSLRQGITMEPWTARDSLCRPEPGLERLPFWVFWMTRQQQRAWTWKMGCNATVVNKVHSNVIRFWVHTYFLESRNMYGIEYQKTKRCWNVLTMTHTLCGLCLSMRLIPQSAGLVLVTAV